MYPAINLGPFVIPTAIFALLLGGWLALSVVERAAPRAGAIPARLYALATTTIIAALVGARLTFVFFHWEAFRHNLLGIIWPLNSGYELWGGLLFAGLSVYFYIRRDGLLPGVVLDTLLPGLLTLLTFVSLSDFLGGSGYGLETTMPWGLRLFDLPVKRHPVQLYEIAVGGLALWSWFHQTRGRRLAPATPVYERSSILIPTAIYSGGRLFVEAYKANSLVIGEGWRLVQIFYLLLLVVALSFYVRQAPAAVEQDQT